MTTANMVLSKFLTRPLMSEWPYFWLDAKTA